MRGGRGWGKEEKEKEKIVVSSFPLPLPFRLYFFLSPVFLSLARPIWRPVRSTCSSPQKTATQVTVLGFSRCRSFISTIAAVVA